MLCACSTLAKCVHPLGPSCWLRFQEFVFKGASLSVHMLYNTRTTRGFMQLDFGWRRFRDVLLL